MRRATANVLVTLGNDQIQSRVSSLLIGSDVLALQEWPKHRDILLQRRGWDFRRPILGGGPIGVRTSLGERVLSCRAKMLRRPGRVDVVTGRRTFLGPTWATRVKSQRADGSVVVRYNIHLKAGIQAGLRGYRTDRPLSVARHKAERTKLQKLVWRDIDRGYDVEVYGDTNYHRMAITGLNAWWDGCPGSQCRTLGNRAIDGIYTSDPTHPGPVTFLPPVVQGEHRHVIARQDDGQ